MDISKFLKEVFIITKRYHKAGHTSICMYRSDNLPHNQNNKKQYYRHSNYL